MSDPTTEVMPVFVLLYAVVIALVLLLDKCDSQRITAPQTTEITSEIEKGE